MRFFPFTCILEFCYLYIFGHFRVIFLAITGDEHLQSLQEIMSELPDMKKYAIGSQQADLPPEFIAMDEVLLRTLPVPLSPACRGEQSLLILCVTYTRPVQQVGWFKTIATSRALPTALFFPSSNGKARDIAIVFRYTHNAL